MKFEIIATISDSHKAFQALLAVSINQGSSLSDGKGLCIISPEIRKKFDNFISTDARISLTDLVGAVYASDNIISSLKETKEKNSSRIGGEVANKLIDHHLACWCGIKKVLDEMKVKFNNYMVAKNGKLF